MKMLGELNFRFFIVFLWEEFFLQCIYSEEQVNEHKKIFFLALENPRLLYLLLYPFQPLLSLLTLTLVSYSQIAHFSLAHDFSIHLLPPKKAQKENVNFYSRLVQQTPIVSWLTFSHPLALFLSLSHLLFTQQNKPNIFSQPFPHTNILTLITFSQFFHHCCCYRIIPCVILKKRWVVCICMCATMWWITILLANGLSTMYKVLLVLNKLKSIDFDCFGNEVFLGNSITL